MAQYDAPPKFTEALFFVMEQNFRHRHNKDGTYDSICLKCYQTVSTKYLETQLLQPEEEHVCCYQMSQNLVEFVH